MGSLLRSVLSRPRTEARDNETSAITIRDWQNMFAPGAQVNYLGQTYQAYSMTTTPSGSTYYDSNPIVFACEQKRVQVFGEARFQWQNLDRGQPGRLWGNTELAVLEEPWPGATTRDLLTVAELDILQYGNSYWVRGSDGYLLRLDPAHVKYLAVSDRDDVSGFDVGSRLVGYAHFDPFDNTRVTVYDPREIAHYRPIPSRNPFVGQSWITPALADIDADQQMTEHKRVQLRKGANLSYVVSLDSGITPAQFREFMALFQAQHAGPENAGKTLFLGGGADVKTVSQTWENLNLKATQGATETRIAACAGTHPVIVGLSEGMAGSSLNAGNYTAAKRQFVDGTIRPLWGSFCGAFQFLVNVPAGSRLWYDDRDIAFLREDVRDQAEISGKDAQTLRNLLDAGFDPDSAVEAVITKDFNKLAGQHSGLFSVQLQAPVTEQPDTGESAPPQPPEVESP